MLNKVKKERSTASAAPNPKRDNGNSAGNPIHRKLRFHEKKLLKKHDFMQYPADLWHEPYAVAKYNLVDREDYRRYFRLVGLIRGLMSHLRYLPSDSRIRIQITEELVGKLFDMGLIQDRMGLQEVDKVGVEAFCKRRLSTVLTKLKMAPNCALASETITHGHIRVGVTQIRDPAFLVPRGLDDHVTWLDRSKIKQHIALFNGQGDDF